MQENPPYSIAEIRLLLIQYLEGDMEADQRAEIDTLLAQNPPYQAELLKLQATRNTMHALTDPDAPADSPLWNSIVKQLQADGQADLLPCDPEFISAYYDGEIPSSDAAFRAFEAQLYRNDEANRLLGNFGRVSDTVRQFGYRLEESCTLDIAAQVMAAYRAEIETGQPASAIAEPPVDPKLELISAYADQALSARETIEANRLIEADEAARMQLHRFNRLSEHIQTLSGHLQEQAPNLTPQVMGRFVQERKSARIASLAGRKKQWQSALRVALPVSAAAALLLLFLPAMQNTSRVPVAATASAGLSTNSTELRSVRYADDDSRHLASVPMANTFGQAKGDSVVPVSLRHQMSEMDAAAPMGGAMAPAAPSPAAEPPTLADAKAEARSADLQTRSDRKTPSSDEYLFEALSEQMPDEDISTILGQ